MLTKHEQHYGTNVPEEVTRALDFVPCKILKQASKDTPCGLKGCFRCKRWFYEQVIKMEEDEICTRGDI